MATYTKQQVVQDRKCGLKYLDKAVAAVGMQRLLDETVRIHHQYPNTWGPGWPNVAWAFGNAFRDHCGARGDISSTFNLDEALTDVEMDFLAKSLGIVDPYEPLWPRRAPGKERKPRVKPGAVSTPAE